MLQFLTIENYALIDHLEFHPGKGLTVITGETGAGKSIIMGALGLILGQRADAKAVRSGAGKCVIEAQFDISAYDLEAFFAQNDLEYDASATIIRREIYATGKSRAFVNDTPVQLPLLRELGSHLIDIHSQHQNLLLGQDAFQLSVVDALAHNQAEYASYRAAYDQLKAHDSKLKALRAQAERDAQEPTTYVSSSRSSMMPTSSKANRRNSKPNRNSSAMPRTSSRASVRCTKDSMAKATPWCRCSRAFRRRPTN